MSSLRLSSVVDTRAFGPVLVLTFGFYVGVFHPGEHASRQPPALRHPCSLFVAQLARRRFLRLGLHAAASSIGEAAAAAWRFRSVGPPKANSAVAKKGSERRTALARAAAAA